MGLKEPWYFLLRSRSSAGHNQAFRLRKAPVPRKRTIFIAVINSVSKPKLRDGLCYVLKTSQLAQALSEAQIDTAVDLRFWTPIGNGSILEAYYWLPNANVSYPRVYVRAGVVPLALRTAASGALAESALPAFIRWLQRIIELPDNSPELYGGELYFDAQYTENGLTITHQPVYKVRRRGK
jgi:hypothetical protein